MSILSARANQEIRRHFTRRPAAASLKNEFVPDVTSLFRQQLKVELSIDDCDARIFRYYEDFNGIVEDKRLQGLIGNGNEPEAGYKSRMKARCRLLVDNPQPPVLKAQISRLIDLERRDSKSDDVALFDLILEHANVQQRFHRMSQDNAAIGDSKSAKSEQKPQRSDTNRSGRSPRPAPYAASTSSPPRTSQPAQHARPPPHDHCLVYKGLRWLKDCPNTTDVQREEARRKFREAKEQRSGVLRSKAAQYATPAGDVRINGLLEVPYTPETGADKGIVPHGIVESLLAVQPTLVATPLRTPVEARMADGRLPLCDKEILLDLGLSTIAGLVAMWSLQIVRLAGQPTLTGEADEFSVGDAIPEVQKAPSVDDAIEIEHLVAQDVVNGMSVQYVAAGRRILAEYHDVWRGTFGPDPPARVEPLRVTLQADVVPHRGAPRRTFPFKLNLFDGVFAPGRVPQGVTDSALHFQGEMQKVLALIPHSALVWVDDVILFAPTVEEFVHVLGQLVSLVAGARLKLNMAKSKLFEVEVLWCGRLISSAGVRHDPARVNALFTPPLPATVVDLQYFICTTNWRQDSLPDYARKIAPPLQTKLAAEKKRVGGRGRNALAVATVWTEPEQAAYEAGLSLVRASALMASPDPDAELLVLTDASLNGYSIVVTQVVDWDPTLPVAKQRHGMMICKGGTFKTNV
ncbi:unnamed protein product [Phytophthora fragariaefolia]|uniref:Unnamed protein product n=1 Tax=Phytophthora fragariaefolia TaxID=1490495 RepID=A0A9W6TXM7_9STRA|nr:unnamed protein product [Phytophthora fragariaefolia]